MKKKKSNSKKFKKVKGQLVQYQPYESYGQYQSRARRCFPCCWDDGCGYCCPSHPPVM
ncbi:hypothetical protein PMI05_01387 [Brevibacillus sp. BC25]|nr:hypothetical protein PMI05_01387 [Brevibacillus sp. BC25]